MSDPDEPSKAPHDPSSSHPTLKAAPRTSTTSSTRQSPTDTSFWRIPGPLRTLFDAVPLYTYPVNALPQRAAALGRARCATNNGTLWVWSTAGERMSFNPSCLRMQAYLKFMGVAYVNVPSNNHASPSGALPFLVTEKGDVVVSGKMRAWALESAKRREEEEDARTEAYLSLVEGRIRAAWLFMLHHTPLFASLTKPLYILPASSSLFVRSSLSHQLLAAATAELQKSSPSPTAIDAKEIYVAAEEAFEALNTLLGDDEWFFGAARPGWLDAVVFGYTGLILRGRGPEQGWRELKEGTLGQMVTKREALTRHCERIIETFFGEQ